MKAKMLFLSVGLKVISGLLFVPLVTGGNLLTKPPPPKRGRISFHVSYSGSDDLLQEKI